MKYSLNRLSMKKNKQVFLILVMMFCQLTIFSQQRFKKAPPSDETIGDLATLLIGEPQENKEILQRFSDNWEMAYVPMLLDVMYFSRGQVDRRAILKLIEEKTNKRLGGNLHDWYEWIWNQDQQIFPFQGDWMAKLYKSIDPKFEQYFSNRTQASLIRLDEVRWGGVRQDGIPPLRQPKMLDANDADYLADTDVVFGITINGDHRAYPKRILAWHEMFVDEIGGESIAGVYCTLCGTVIAYNTKHNGKNYNLGTSGFLYRSNKLMYDKATQSLWNTIEGKPVIGPLIKSNIELASHAVVTTTWGEWKKLHPSTTVLSLDTGHQRNYDEGNAYKDYFSTDRLMFNVPEIDTRLNNKAEVLIVRTEGYKADPLAISAAFLNRKKVYQNKIGDTKFVVLTDRSGGNRVYESKDYKFKKIKNNTVTDAEDRIWSIEEEQLIASDGTTLNRLPYHRIFWFAWYNTYKNTRLVR